MTDEDWDELWEELIRQGVIDAQGRVLKRAPEPPEDTPGNGKTKKPAHAREKGRRASQD